MTETQKEDADTRKADKDCLWRCADPGCAKRNPSDAAACQQCRLARPANRNNNAGSFKGRGGRGGRGGHRGDRKNQDRRNRDRRDVDMEGPLIADFKAYADTLDAKHDKQERVVKLSRDITIESKRVIFLLHRITCEDDKPTVLLEAERKLSYIRYSLWKPLAYELKKEDPYRFLRNYTNGLQEYVEALSFYHYLCFGKLIQCHEVQRELIFEIGGKKKKFQKEVKKEDSKIQDEDDSTTLSEDVSISVVENPSDGAKENLVSSMSVLAEVEADKVTSTPLKRNPALNIATLEISTSELTTSKIEPIDFSGDVSGKTDEVTPCKEENNNEDNVTQEKEVISVHVPQIDFILGLADLSGEVMRQAINLVATGETSVCFDLLQFLHDIYDGFLKAQAHFGNREMNKKISVLKQSLHKVENACYNINVRGSEIPKHHLVNYFKSTEEDSSMEQNYEE